MLKTLWHHMVNNSQEHFLENLSIILTAVNPITMEKFQKFNQI